jgi:hypothetical protein
MKFVLGIMVAAFMVTAAPARAQDADKVAKAEAAALAWLALTDAGDYPHSWDHGQCRRNRHAASGKGRLMEGIGVFHQVRSAIVVSR